MKVIGHFVGIGADQRSFHFVDSAIESLKGHLPELVWKGALQQRIKVLPEATTTTYDIFPKPRLALMHADRRSASQRGAVERGIDALLVERMPGLMQI